MATDKKSHFQVLDGLRGVAAYCVFLVHCFSRHLVANGFLGVDLFFMLSGFVIAYSYRSRLMSGMTLREFALRRFVRLYPMIAAGTILGLMTAIIHNLGNPNAYAIGDLVKWTATSLLMFPSFGPDQIEDALFPLNTVLWSLFFELLANLFYALLVRRLTKPVLAILMFSGLAGVVAIGPLGGATVSDYWGGVARIAFGFFAGNLLFELWSEGKFSKFSLGLFPSSVILVAIANIPGEIQGAAFIPVAIAFSCLLALAANAKPDERSVKICGFLGAISYPMYLVHRPMLYLFLAVAKRLDFVDDPNRYFVTVVISMLLITIMSYATLKLYEMPARLLLARLLLKQRKPEIV